MNWRPARIGLATEPIIIAGLDVWGYEWRQTGERVSLPHPDYPDQMHLMQVYEIGPTKNPVRFAADELSNGVWGFYVPDGDSRPE